MPCSTTGNLRLEIELSWLMPLNSSLSRHPTVATRRRKHLRPNQLAEWELRIEDSRVFYDVEEDNEVVVVVAIGVKEHNTLYIAGEEFTL